MYTCKAGTVITTGCPNYGDIMMMSMFEKRGMFASLNDKGMQEGISKIAMYHITYMKAMSELSKALSLATTYTAPTSMVSPTPDTAKDAIVKAVDGAWAYYAGNKGTTSVVALSLSSYAVEFGLCYSTFTSIVTQFKDAQTAANKGDMTAMKAAIAEIPGVTSVPHIQGCIRYAHKLSGLPTNTDANIGAAMEAWAFCSALFPQMSAADAKTVRDMIDPSKNATVVSKTITDALAGSYNSFGTTAAKVGMHSSKTLTQADMDKCQSTMMSGGMSGASVTTASPLLALFAATAVALYGSR